MRDVPERVADADVVRLGVYASAGSPGSMVLVPLCMQPSLDCAHRLGYLAYAGSLDLAERGLRALVGTAFAPLLAGEEVVIEDGATVSQLRALLEG